MSHSNIADANCPSCGTSNHVKPKTLLVDSAWVKIDGEDPREAHFASIRLDDIKPEFLNTAPLQQFVAGFYCEQCDIGFIPDNYETSGARYYYLRRNFEHKSKT